MGGVAIADRMGRAVADRHARIAELAEAIAAAQAEEEQTLRDSFRSDPGARFDATSKVAQIRRRRQKLESEREGLLSDLRVLEEEARAAARDAARERAEKALTDLRECRRVEAAFRSELKGDLLRLFDRFVTAWPGLWAEWRAAEDKAYRACADASMDQEFSHARDQAHVDRTAETFLAQIEAAVRSIRLGELQGDARAAVERNPGLLFRFVTPEESPAYVEPTPIEHVWIDMTSAPLASIEGPHAAKQLVRQWQSSDGKVHPAVSVSSSAPSDAQLAERDDRTGVDRWRRVDAALLR